MKDCLLKVDNKEFAQDMARRYLEADSDSKDDIEAFFHSHGHRMIKEAGLKYHHGIPTTEELEGWFSL